MCKIDILSDLTHSSSVNCCQCLSVFLNICKLKDKQTALHLQVICIEKLEISDNNQMNSRILFDYCVVQLFDYCVIQLFDYCVIQLFHYCVTQLFDYCVIQLFDYCVIQLFDYLCYTVV